MSKLTVGDRRKLLDLLLKGNSILLDRRGRETVMVSAGLEDLLPMIELEGRPIVVVTEMLRFLEGYGPLAYDQTALGRFLNTMKDFVGPQDQRLLDSCLTGYGLMSPVLSISEEIEWEQPVDISDAFELIIGENTLRPVAFLRRGLEVAGAVALVAVQSGASEWLGTGFMVSPELLLTCHHVLRNRDILAGTVFRFNYQTDFLGNPEPFSEFSARAEGIYHSNEELDYAIVEVDGSPGDEWGFLPLEIRSVMPNSRVNMVQHPHGLPKQISFQNNFVQYAGQKVVQYLTTTMKGSSGSPVMNDDWEVVALHHAGSPIMLEPGTNRRYFRNEGIAVGAILSDLPKEVRRRLSE